MIWVENLRQNPPRLGLFFRVVLFGVEIPSKFLESDCDRKNERYLELGKTCELTIVYMMKLAAFSQIDGRCPQERKAMSREIVLAQKPCQYSHPD
jgi:hypothetical protein